jgi:hypothetical protein
VERKVSCPKGNPTKLAPSKDHFERLLDAPCPHHEVPVKHSLKDRQLIKNCRGSLPLDSKFVSIVCRDQMVSA